MPSSTDSTASSKESLTWEEGRDWDSDIQRRWYAALYEEDCVKLMNLLRERASLWKEGWASNPKLPRVRGRPGNYWHEEEECDWRGRTALHVGVRRGCEALTKKVLELWRAERSLRDPVSLMDFLFLKDGEYELDSVQLAVINGNQDVLTELLLAARDSAEFSGMGKGLENRKRACCRKAEVEKHMRKSLKEITRDVLGDFPKEKDRLIRVLVMDRYKLHRNFNFLPRDEYLFHFLFTKYEETSEREHLRPNYESEFSESEVSGFYAQVVGKIAEKVGRSQLGCFLWGLRDGQGRLPLHVAMEEMGLPILTVLGALRRSMPSLADTKRVIMARDGLGRTALHRAFALGRPSHRDFWGWMWNSDSTCKETRPWTENMQCAFLESLKAPQDVAFFWEWMWNNVWTIRNCRSPALNDPVRARTGWVPQHSGQLDDWPMALHSAILRRRQWVMSDILQSVLDLAAEPKPTNLRVLSDMDEWLSQTVRLDVVNNIWRKHLPISACQKVFKATLNCVALATLIGDVDLLSQLLELKWHVRYHTRNITGKEILENTKSRVPLNIAAGLGNYELFKIITEDFDCDPYGVDSAGNTALHYAMKGCDLVPRFPCRLSDFADLGEILELRGGQSGDLGDPILPYRQGFDKESLIVEDRIVEREGCLNLLIQRGCDILKENERGEVPYPANHMSHLKFLSWWYHKQAKEVGMQQRSLTFAASAISVTAALVASTSFMGPLQPPGGYDDVDTDQLRVRSTANPPFLDSLPKRGATTRKI